MAGTGLGGGIDDDGARPWLEPVEVDQQPSGPGPGRAILIAILAVAILAAAGAAYSWWSKRGATEGHGEIIRAPAGPYKVKPSDPGGMEVEGEGDSAFVASAGGEPEGRIDTSAVPEEPILAGPQGGGADGAGSGSGPIQLGAFSSEAAAKAAWEALSGRFAYLQPLSHAIIEVKTGETSLYRLRASGPGAAGICGRLQIAGEECVALN